MTRKLATPPALLTIGLLVACTDPVQPPVDQPAVRPQLSTVANACWGQATQVFARMGAMGEHAAEQPNPRVGLANLARDLFELGVISEPTLQALGAFVADAEGLSIEACMT